MIFFGFFHLTFCMFHSTKREKTENQEIINDLNIAAYNNAKENLKKKSAEELSKVTGGLNLPPDFKLPF